MTLPESYLAVHRYEGAIIQRGHRTELIACTLRQRDLAIVRDVWRYHFLTTEQLQELWWAGRSPQAARRRLVKLFRAGHLERFRPYAPRGSYSWTYYLGPAGHQLLRNLGAIDARTRFHPRTVFDYSYAVHDLQLNAWVLTYRRLLDGALEAWHGETQIDPPPETRGQLQLGDNWSAEGLKDRRARSVRPDAVLEIARPDSPEPRIFLIEHDRTRRVDKNYEKFRRYDTFLNWWWRYTNYRDHSNPPYVLFICQDAAQRDTFLAAADRELTGHRWHPSRPPSDHDHVGRRRVLFACEPDLHMGRVEARRLPPWPPNHPARRGCEADVRGVNLPLPTTAR